MPKGTRFIALSVAAFLILVASFFTPKASMQSDFTLAGEWVMVSSPIDNQLVSRMGNSLGFPDRDMIFEQQGDMRTGMVLREEGENVRPLGVWRVKGDKFSATFQLWCPDSRGTCGSVIMRGEFVRDDKVKGTMTVFFDQEDNFRPTGYDTWVFSFSGNRVSGGSN